MIAVIWAQLGPAELLIVGAALAGFDAATGLSVFLSKKIGSAKNEDLFLLLFVVVVGVLTIRLIAALSYDHSTALIEFISARDMSRQLVKDAIFLAQVRQAEPFVKAIIAAQMAFGTICFLISRRQSRSVVLWIPISLLCNLGGIIWLTVRRQALPRLPSNQ